MAIGLERPAVTSGEHEALAAPASTRVHPTYTPGDDTTRHILHDTAAVLLLALGEYGALINGAICYALLRPFAAHRKGPRPSR